jgi:hypothetical protein
MQSPRQVPRALVFATVAQRPSRSSPCNRARGDRPTAGLGRPTVPSLACRWLDIPVVVGLRAVRTRRIKWSRSMVPSLALCVAAKSGPAVTTSVSCAAWSTSLLYRCPFGQSTQILKLIRARRFQLKRMNFTGYQSFTWPKAHLAVQRTREFSCYRILDGVFTSRLEIALSPAYSSFCGILAQRSDCPMRDPLG